MSPSPTLSHRPIADAETRSAHATLPLKRHRTNPAAAGRAARTLPSVTRFAPAPRVPQRRVFLPRPQRFGHVPCDCGPHRTRQPRAPFLLRGAARNARRPAEESIGHATHRNRGPRAATLANPTTRRGCAPRRPLACRQPTSPSSDAVVPSRFDTTSSNRTPPRYGSRSGPHVVKSHPPRRRHTRSSARATAQAAPPSGRALPVFLLSSDDRLVVQPRASRRRLWIRPSTSLGSPAGW